MLHSVIEMINFVKTFIRHVWSKNIRLEFQERDWWHCTQIQQEFYYKQKLMIHDKRNKARHSCSSVVGQNLISCSSAGIYVLLLDL